MADAATTFRIKALIDGLDKVEGLKKAVQSLQTQARPAAQEIGRVRRAANALGQSSNASANDIRRQITVLENLRGQLAINSRAYRQFGNDIDIARSKLASFNVTAKKGGGFMAGAKAAAPTALSAASASFLPASAQFGALAGFQASGMSGALAGGAIGLTVAGAVGLAQQAGDAAKYSASISRLEIALKAVTKTSEAYAQAQRVIRTVTDELNVPIEVSTKQFTTLSASVLGAGGSVKDAEKVFRGVSEAIKATGGNAEDVQSGIRAMSQIFGKGKVSAEELQGQLGERLPGAVVKFANATGRTLPELQKDLRDGTVGLNDVMKFVVKLSEDHRSAALRMAGSTEEAGQRMDVALKDLKRNFGEFFQPIGAGFQNIIADMADMVNAAVTAGRLMDQLNIRGGFNEARQELVNRARAEADQLAELRGLGAIGRAKLFDERLKDLLMQMADKQGLKIKPEDLIGTREEWNVAGENASNSVKKYSENIKTAMEEIKDATQRIFKKMEDQLVEFITKGKLNFQEFASSIIEEMTRIFVRTQIMKPLTTWFEGLNFFANAKGNVYAQNGIVPFAKGGVVDKPTLFPFAKGAGLMGEAGPEAIMPLKRSQDGRLGVEAAMGRYSGSGGNTTVNYTGPVMNFNGDDYVPRSAVTDIINAAANRGASIGEARTLSSLRNSRSRRSNLGL
jgi:tape measure domain-containing protein